MARRKMTRPQIRKAKRLAEKLKGKRRVRNPHALSRWLVKHRKGRRRR